MKKNVFIFFLISLPAILALAQTPAKPKPPPIKIVVPQKSTPTPQGLPSTNPSPTPSTAVEFETKEYPGGEFYELNTVAGSGNLTVTNSPTSMTKISVRRPKVGSRCQLQMLKSAEPPSMLVRSASVGGETCVMDGTISLPDGIRFSGSLDSGSFKLVNIKNIADLTMDSGEISVEGSSGEPRITIKKGSINLERWNSSAIIKVLDNANVKCNYASLPAFGTFSIESRDGNIELNIPKLAADKVGTDYNIKFKTEMGELLIKRN